MNQINICIAGLGTVGSNLIKIIRNNSKLIDVKTSLFFNIAAVSAKNRLKKRICNINSYKWFDNPLDLIKVKDCNVLIEFWSALTIKIRSLAITKPDALLKRTTIKI